MNELIRKLATETDVNVAHANKPMSERETMELWVQLFAESLIKECAHLCVVVAEEVEDQQPNKNFDTVAYDCHDRIKHHFGIKT